MCSLVASSVTASICHEPSDPPGAPGVTMNVPAVMLSFGLLSELGCTSVYLYFSMTPSWMSRMNQLLFRAMGISLPVTRGVGYMYT